MQDMINPMQDMGFIADKQAIIEPQGVLTPCNVARCLCQRYIPDGGKFYDLVDRYDNVTSFVLNRDDSMHSGNVLRIAAPFLKAFGATDYDARVFFDRHMSICRGGHDLAEYLANTMPAYMDTSMYEHAVDSLGDKLGVDLPPAGLTGLCLDDIRMSPGAAEVLRGISSKITSVKLPTDRYELDVPLQLSSDEVNMVSAMDDIFLKRLQGTPIFDSVESMQPVGANEKAYTLLDIRKATQIDLDGTMFIGGEPMDLQVMDLVRDGSGLSLAFNGSDFAVHGANVAVISDDSTPVALIAAEFYDTGIQGVYELVENWNREYLAGSEMPDRGLADTILERYPTELPEVVRVTRDNVDDLALRSDAFRRKVFKNNSYSGPLFRQVGAVRILHRFSTVESYLQCHFYWYI